MGGRRIAPTLIAALPAVRKSLSAGSAFSLKSCVDKCYARAGVAAPASARAFGEPSSFDAKWKQNKQRREKSFNEMLERFKKYEEVEQRAAELDKAHDEERKAERKARAVQKRAVLRLAKMQLPQLNTGEKAERRKARAAVRRAKFEKMHLERVAAGVPSAAPELRSVTKAKKKVDSASRVLRKARREAQALAKREERHAKRRARGRPSASPNREERHAKRRAWGRPSHTPKPKKKKKSPP
jgi:hypothetical protein